MLDADLAAAFDHLNHDHICESLGTFPAVGLVRRWLEAGVIEDGRFVSTEEGAPQGGVISPLLLNVALHGMEAAAGVRYHTTGTRAGKTMPNCPVVIRYADDLLALCHSRDQAEQVKARLAEWLAPRGLVFNETKTQITNFDEGVDFLSFTIRRFRGKLLTKPSNDAMRRIRKRLSTEVKALRGANADTVIAKLNPIITGWAAYYRIGVSKRAFGALDAHMWRLVYKWASFSHSNKSKRWVIARYFGMFNPARQDKWIFGSRKPASTCASSPGHRSSGTGWWQERRPRTTRACPNTGPSGAAAAGHRWARPRCDSCESSTADAHSAGVCCYTPIVNRKARTGGNSGSQPPARRSANTRSPSGGQARRTNAPQPVSYTPTAAVEPPAAAMEQHHCSLLASLQGLLEPVAWKAGTAGSEGAPGFARGSRELKGSRWEPEGVHLLRGDSCLGFVVNPGCGVARRGCAGVAGRRCCIGRRWSL